MLIIGFIITLFYVLLIGSFILGFDKIKVFKLEKAVSKTTYSVIIPFRNEAKNLPVLLESISKLNYPKHLYEVIFVDDESEDESANIIHKVLDTSRLHRDTRTDMTIINNERKTKSPKKDAITSAINLAKHEWIISTDADCQLPEFWLNCFDEFIQQTNAKCIVAPVTYCEDTNFLNRFQALDLISLQGATIGGFGINKPFLCNGANFGYQKAIFKELNGFEGNTNMASGDDIFLLEKMIKSYPKESHYLKCDNAIVTTKPQESWKELLMQRIRWAAKTSAYNNGFGKLTGLIVLSMNALIVTALLLSLINMFNAKTLLYILVIKLYLDFLLIYKTASFFNQRSVLKSYLAGFLVYPFFSVFIAFLSIFNGYTWKGRTFKK
ncbi:glycosyltransferase family 2 protein [Confluentibacter flavum]|uniref:Glycosyltransferase n=1 Tax=Confluentibacter flavum TaxID=1909700 RepID=A0A2N3HFT9_9FLAO|nr:glycosyltransferase [Confluentibacter flavum]PKQ43754.1 glycosyltransferase [Confluentibacter flavum]